MKKLITLTFIITALLLGAIAINAQSGSKKHKKGISHNKPINKKYGNNNYYPIGYYKGHYNARGIYVYYTNKRVWKYGRLFKNTYKVKVKRNGRKTVNLIKSVPIQRHYGKRVFYKKQVIKRGSKRYLVTYKITRFPNGKVKKKIVKKERIYNSYNW